MGWAEGNGTGGALTFSIGGVGLVVDFAVGANGDATMNVEISLNSGDDGTGGMDHRNAILVR